MGGLLLLKLAGLSPGKGTMHSSFPDLSGAGAACGILLQDGIADSSTWAQEFRLSFKNKWGNLSGKIYVGFRVGALFKNSGLV